MESISIIKGATTVKKEAEKVQRQKSFFCTNTTCFYSVQCDETNFEKEIYIISCVALQHTLKDTD